MIEYYNNTLIVKNNDGGENYSIILSPGDRLSIMRGENYRSGRGLQKIQT